MHNLRPAILEQGLVAALQWMTQRFEQRTGVSTVFRTSHEALDLPAGVPLVAYRTVQEALTNISKHAQASRVSVDLSASRGMLSLEITDNGRGLRAGGPRQGAQLRHPRPARARPTPWAAGSSCPSNPGRGTTLHAVGAHRTRPHAAWASCVGDAEAGRRRRDAILPHGVSCDRGDPVRRPRAHPARHPRHAVRRHRHPRRRRGRRLRRAARSCMRRRRCDVLLLDINLPGRSGLDALHALQDEGAPVKVLIVSMYPEDQYAIRALRAGAPGYVNKGGDPQLIVQAVRTVAAGPQVRHARDRADAGREPHRADGRRSRTRSSPTASCRRW
jgi:CheY-like chemotaxis protein